MIRVEWVCLTTTMKADPTVRAALLIHLLLHYAAAHALDLNFSVRCIHIECFNSSYINKSSTMKIRGSSNDTLHTFTSVISCFTRLSSPSNRAWAREDGRLQMWHWIHINKSTNEQRQQVLIAAIPKPSQHLEWIHSFCERNHTLTTNRYAGCDSFQSYCIPFPYYLHIMSPCITKW